MLTYCLDSFTMAEAARTARLGLLVGFAYGVVQDTVSLLRGRRLGYVDFVQGLFRSHDRAS